MTEPIEFYHNPFSRGGIVHWMLEEVGVPYKMNLLSFKNRENKNPEYLAINPMGKVPAILCMGEVVTEAAAICAYLADKFPEAKLAPKMDDSGRGAYLRWLFFGAGCFEPAIIDKMFSRPMPDPGSLGYGTYQDVVSVLTETLSKGPYLLGERFSAADVYLAAQMSWAIMVKGLESNPIFDSYLSQCKERPAYKRYNSQFQELAKRLKEKESKQG